MSSLSRPCIVALFAVLSPALSRADSTINETDKYAYSANAGWLNFKHDQPTAPGGVVFGEYICAGYAYAANFGWVHFGDGTPANGISYQNNSSTDYGVNHDGNGNLSGYSWAANVGWINFGWAQTTNPNRARVDLTTGEFQGYAYGANIGWINLGAGHLITDVMQCTDTDGDGIGDEWEVIWFGDLITANDQSDQDGDRRNDLEEYQAQTDPTDSSDFPQIVSVSLDDVLGQKLMTVDFTTSPNRFYVIETTEDFQSWFDSGFGEFSPSSGTLTTKTISLPAITPRQFARVKAVKPLQP